MDNLSQWSARKWLPPELVERWEEVCILLRVQETPPTSPELRRAITEAYLKVELLEKKLRSQGRL